MDCESCGRDSPGGPGEPCLWCGHTRGGGPSDTAPSEPAASAPGSSPWATPRAQGAATAPRPASGGIPWEAAQDANTLLETLKRIFLEPTATFASATPGVGLGPSVGYALLLGFIGGAVGQLYQWMMGNTLTNLLKPMFETNPALREALESAGGAAPFGAILVIPIAVVLGVFIWAGVTHVCLMILGVGGARIEDTVRGLGFVYGTTALFNLVPYVGGVVGMVWGTVVGVVALRELHRTTTAKATLAVVLPGLSLSLCCCCAGITLAGAIGGSVLGR